jgi:hypothetical protein
MDEPTAAPEILAEARKIEGICTRKAIAHRRAADFWNRTHYTLGLPSAVLAAVAGTSALSNFDHSNFVAGILALLVAVLTGLTTWLNPHRTADLHRTASNAYLALGSRSGRLWRIDAFANRSNDELRLTVYEIAEALDKADAESPHLPARVERRVAGETIARAVVAPVASA